MASANNSLVVGKLQGMIGKEIVFRDWEGKTVVAKAPRSPKGQPNANQLRIRESFRYAKQVLKNPELAEAYRAVLKPRQSVLSRALQDFVTPPRVISFHTREYRGLVGNPILIRALDDFEVKEIYVEIYDAAGVLLEEGKAQPVDGSDQWIYTATVANSQVAGSILKAIAVDLPGNEGSLEVVLG
jgi:hypothetical protein